jgi:hypothetical protein
MNRTRQVPGCEAFLTFAFFLLCVTGSAKVISAFGVEPVLNTADPLLRVPLKYTYLASGLLELSVATIVLLCGPVLPRLCVVAWLSSNFAIYHLLWWRLNIREPCPCLGQVAKWLSVSNEQLQMVAKGITAYLLIGAVSLIVLSLTKRRRELATAGTPGVYGNT